MWGGWWGGGGLRLGGGDGAFAFCAGGWGEADPSVLDASGDSKLLGWAGRGVFA